MYLTLLLKKEMKKIYYLLALIMLPVLLNAQGINFEHDNFKQILAKAKKENKLVFIDGYALWCGPCKRMSKTTFMDEKLGEYMNQNFVSLKLDIERGEGPELKQKYNIQGLPGYIFIDNDGVAVHRAGSYLTVDEFLTEAQLAVKYSKDPNSVGRLAERFEQNKTNESFLKMYLDKLYESKAVNYGNVVDLYLNEQTTMADSSKDMVLFLAKFSNQIILGGKADQIIQNNLTSDTWRLYVRKNIRYTFQKMPQKMINNTTEYAIATQDTSLIELALERSVEAGAILNDELKARVYAYYFDGIGNGERYKAIVRPNNEAYINAINVDELSSAYAKWINEGKGGSARPLSVRYSSEILRMVDSYAKYVTTEQDKQDIIRWAKVGYEIAFDDCYNIGQYATMLYSFGNDKEQAIKLQEKALSIAEKEGLKQEASFRADLEEMKKGEPVLFF